MYIWILQALTHISDSFYQNKGERQICLAPYVTQTLGALTREEMFQ